MQSVGSSSSKSCWEESSEIDTRSRIVNQMTKARGWRDMGLCTKVVHLYGSNWQGNSWHVQFEVFTVNLHIIHRFVCSP